MHLMAIYYSMKSYLRFTKSSLEMLYYFVILLYITLVHNNCHITRREGH